MRLWELKLPVLCDGAAPAYRCIVTVLNRLKDVVEPSVVHTVNGKSRLRQAGSAALLAHNDVLTAVPNDLPQLDQSLRLVRNAMPRAVKLPYLPPTLAVFIKDIGSRFGGPPDH